MRPCGSAGDINAFRLARQRRSSSTALRQWTALSATAQREASDWRCGAQSLCQRPLICSWKVSTASAPAMWCGERAASWEPHSSGGGPRRASLRPMPLTSTAHKRHRPRLRRQLDAVLFDELGPLGDVRGQHLTHFLGASASHDGSRQLEPGTHVRHGDRFLDGRLDHV
jgi:hypothetical protein